MLFPLHGASVSLCGDPKQTSTNRARARPTKWHSMNHRLKLALFTLLALGNLSVFGQQGASGQGEIAKLLNSNPEGRYVVSMEFAGGKPRVIVDVGERDVKSVKGSDAEFEEMAGTIERLKPVSFG
jgi:hypothetical protein